MMVKRTLLREIVQCFLVNLQNCATNRFWNIFFTLKRSFVFSAIKPYSCPQPHSSNHYAALDLPFMDSSNKQNHIMVFCIQLFYFLFSISIFYSILFFYFLLHLAFSIQHNILEVHPHGSIFLQLDPVHCIYQLIDIWIASSLGYSFNS